MSKRRDDRDGRQHDPQDHGQHSRGIGKIPLPDNRHLLYFHDPRTRGAAIVLTIRDDPPEPEPMTQADFVAMLEDVLHLRGAAFERRALITWVERVWPLLDADPDPVRWAGEFLEARART